MNLPPACSMYALGLTSTRTPFSKTNVNVGNLRIAEAVYASLALAYFGDPGPMTSAHAFLNLSAARRGKYVSVVPESTMVPLPVAYTAAGTSIETPFISTSSNLTVNHPEFFASGVNRIGSRCDRRSTPPSDMVPPPYMKHNAKTLWSISPCCRIVGTNVCVCIDMPMIPSAFCVRKSPVSYVWHPNTKLVVSHGCSSVRSTPWWWCGEIAARRPRAEGPASTVSPPT
mmetsp:Transcript_7688/g.31807  ORF Transcript_7688/g.31807 Transcript_7688/m.31807 type:complete len:228 (-) Transcript_7688:1241-1924(-)